MLSLPASMKRIRSRTAEKNRRHRFSHYRPMGIFSDVQGQLTPQSEVQSSQNSNSSELSCMSSLPASIIKALQACIIPRHEITIQYKCKEYLTDIQRLICANNNLQAISRKNRIYFPNLLSYMNQSIYRTLIKFQMFTLMKVLFT